MTEQDLNNIRKLATEHRTSPRPQAWARLSEGLGHRQTKIRLSYYQKLSIAAVFSAVICAVALLGHYYSDHHNPDIFASNEQFKPLVLEELEDVSNTSLYTIEDVNGLKQAFARVTNK